MLASASFGKEGVERVVHASRHLVAGNLAVLLDAVLETVQLPARISNLHSGLSNMYADALPLTGEQGGGKKEENSSGELQFVGGG